MLELTRAHDFQVHASPSQEFPALVNPPSFNWPENHGDCVQYTLELKNLSTTQDWSWQQVRSPMQLSETLPPGQYQWRLLANDETDTERASTWLDFQITDDQPDYLAPTAKQLFAHCDGKTQWLMYFDDDVAAIRAQSTDTYTRLKQSAQLSVPLSQISYPSHYRRGQEEAKREAIANVRLWIDRDLMVHALLYRVWGEQEHGLEALQRLLHFAEWSPEGPASLLRPCTWGDEVGCSLARNLFLAYHWLSPLLEESEKAFIRPLLVRIARQMTERLSQDNFRQFPGHSHTSRLPGYLGLAALTLYREHDTAECEQWLSEALMLYRGILPFYGGADGGWVEGPFYASTYSKWFHPFFLSVERLSGFSFYQHPFYQNFHHFARDFITTEQAVHPFGDGFWCTREGKEWPGFFSQNPLRIYAARFGDPADYQRSQTLENAITDFRLHLLDAVPTIRQLSFDTAARNRLTDHSTADEPAALEHYYSHAGLGKATQRTLALYYRASAFGNSSHRHADQGNIALFDHGHGVLIPTGSYGYRFGSQHHKAWTRQTLAHNLPLSGQHGQILDEPSAVGQVIHRQSASNHHLIILDLSCAYDATVEHFHRTLVLVEDYGLIIIDAIKTSADRTLNWRLHSPLKARVSGDGHTTLLSHPQALHSAYQCRLLSHSAQAVTTTHGYQDELSVPTSSIESDASKEVVHLDWQLPANEQHTVIACCIRQGLSFPELLPSAARSATQSADKGTLELRVQEEMMSIPVFNDEHTRRNTR